VLFLEIISACDGDVSTLEAAFSLTGNCRWCVFMRFNALCIKLTLQIHYTFV